MSKKYFTLEEANALLPLIERELVELQRMKRTFEEKYTDLQDKKAEHVYGVQGAAEDEDPFFAAEFELEFLQIEARTLMQSIRRKGAELKDIDSGLIDFPALMGGKEVLLCWKQGEESITHYHGLYDGFAGRRKLEGEA